MHRFFVPEECISEEEIFITGDDVNHIKNVLRMDIGERVVVSCGRGVDYYCVIKALRESDIGLLVEEKREAVAELPAKITLFQALPKRDKMELVIQKAVELGAFEIVPVQSKRCVVRLDAKKEEKKQMRWQAIAEAAAKQSGRGLIPRVGHILSFSEALACAENMDTVLIPYELAEDMAESLEAMKRAAGGKSIGVFIGPEGGFERSEIELAVGKGAFPISLGRRILRTETAGMTVLSVLMYWLEAGRPSD